MAYLYTMVNSHLTGQQSRARGRSYDAKAKCRALLGAGGLGAIVLAGALCAAGALMPQPARAQATASAAVMASDPTAMVKGVVDQAAAVVRDTQTPTAERDRRLRAIAEANFDFADMARTTLGYHWRQITPQQQAQFVPLFTSFMENVYLSKLQEYSVQKVRQDVNTSNVSFSGQQFNGADDAEVHSSVLLKDKPPPIKVDYLLRRDGTEWKIYDLSIDSISVMANYRNQFNRVLNNDGYPALVAMLQKKSQELGSTLDK
jgi:phospholipid transport system substrate-binding protein